MCITDMYPFPSGPTHGLMVADPKTYGPSKLWVILKPIPIELDDDSPAEDGDSPAEDGDS